MNEKMNEKMRLNIKKNIKKLEQQTSETNKKITKYFEKLIDKKNDEILDTEQYSLLHEATADAIRYTFKNKLSILIAENIILHSCNSESVATISIAETAYKKILKAIDEL